MTSILKLAAEASSSDAQVEDAGRSEIPNTQQGVILRRWILTLLGSAKVLNLYLVLRFSAPLSKNSVNWASLPRAPTGKYSPATRWPFWSRDRRLLRTKE